MQDASKKEEQVCGSCQKSRWCNIDHIVPVFFIEQLGLKLASCDHEWNLQYLCRACHSRKNARFDFTDVRTLPNLRRYVEIAAEYYSQ